jgi:hypothetical protein
MRFFRKLSRALWRWLSEGDSRAQKRALEESLRKKISFWEHQALLYELAHLPRGARRCRKIVLRYRVRLLCLTFPGEDD